MIKILGVNHLSTLHKYHRGMQAYLKNKSTVTFFMIGIVIFLISCDDNIKKDSESPYIQSEYDIISINLKETIRNKYASELESLSQDADEFCKNYSSSMGTWNDLDYTLTDSSEKSPIKHLQRIRTLALLLRYDQTKESRKDEYIHMINTALNYWKNNPIEFDNWWQNSIGACTNIGETIILVKQYLSDDNYNYFIEYINNGNLSEWSGANLIDYAWFHFMRGVALSNDSVIESCCDKIYNEITFVEHEGIQEDYSFLSNDIRYIGGYAEVFLSGVLNFAYCVKNTKFAIPENKMQIIRRYILETYIPCCKSSYLDWNAIGRQISRKNHLNRRDFIYRTIGILKEIDSCHLEEYEDAIAYIDGRESNIDQCAFFYKSDYLIKSNKRFCITVGGSSNRIRKPEIGNGENLKGSLLSLGSTSFRVKGDEYYNIFNCWDWCKIPGVSATEVLPAFMNKWGEYGGSNFSGGVSDGIVGAYSFILDMYELHGNKSYYLTDDGLICIGSKLSGFNEMFTTIDQCIYKGSHEIIKDSQGKIKSINHNDILYSILSDNKLNVSIQNIDKPWNEINEREIVEQPDPDVDFLPINKTVFTLSLNDNESHDYAYYVIPKTIENHIETLISNIEVLCNTEDLHAVFDKNRDIVYFTFFTEGSFTFPDNTRIAVEEPCIILAKEVSNERKYLYVSEPTQQKETVHIDINGNKYILNFPKEDKGRTMRLEVKI